MKNITKFTTMLVLIPFFFILALSTLNMNNKLSLRILLWKTPQLSLGNYILIGYSLGFLSSFSSIAVISTKNNSFKRKYKYNKHQVNTSYEELNNEKFSDLEETYNNDNYIERDIRDPSPTLTVPYRVIQSNNNYSELSYENIHDNDIENTEKSTDLNYQKLNNNKVNNNLHSYEWDYIDLENW
tara:strand:+ start:17792 stop:18343 length:552 start_codon:yes stop_codon:yes gene_type:complete